MKSDVFVCATLVPRDFALRHSHHGESVLFFSENSKRPYNAMYTIRIIRISVRNSIDSTPCQHVTYATEDLLLFLPNPVCFLRRRALDQEAPRESPNRQTIVRVDHRSASLRLVQPSLGVRSTALEKEDHLSRPARLGWAEEELGMLGKLALCSLRRRRRPRRRRRSAWSVGGTQIRGS